jgi:hypothetical protein
MESGHMIKWTSVYFFSKFNENRQCHISQIDPRVNLSKMEKVFSDESGIYPLLNLNPYLLNQHHLA